MAQPPNRDSKDQGRYPSDWARSEAYRTESLDFFRPSRQVGDRPDPSLSEGFRFPLRPKAGPRSSEGAGTVPDVQLGRGSRGTKLRYDQLPIMGASPGQESSYLPQEDQMKGASNRQILADYLDDIHRDLARKYDKLVMEKLISSQPTYTTYNYPSAVLTFKELVRSMASALLGADVYILDDPDKTAPEAYVVTKSRMPWYGMIVLDHKKKGLPPPSDRVIMFRDIDAAIAAINLVLGDHNVSGQCKSE